MLAKQGEALRPLKETLVEDLVSEEVDANGSVRAADVVAIAATQCNAINPPPVEWNATRCDAILQSCCGAIPGEDEKGSQGKGTKGKLAPRGGERGDEEHTG